MNNILSLLPVLPSLFSWMDWLLLSFFPSSKLKILSLSFSSPDITWGPEAVPLIRSLTRAGLVLSPLHSPPGLLLLFVSPSCWGRKDSGEERRGETSPKTWHSFLILLVLLPSPPLLRPLNLLWDSFSSFAPQEKRGKHVSKLLQRFFSSVASLLPLQTHSKPDPLRTFLPLVVFSKKKTKRFKKKSGQQTDKRERERPSRLLLLSFQCIFFLSLSSLLLLFSSFFLTPWSFGRMKTKWVYEHKEEESSWRAKMREIEQNLPVGRRVLYKLWKKEVKRRRKKREMRDACLKPFCLLWRLFLSKV